MANKNVNFKVIKMTTTISGSLRDVRIRHEGETRLAKGASEKALA